MGVEVDFGASDWNDGEWQFLSCADDVTALFDPILTVTTGFGYLISHPHTLKANNSR
jgi:hypothetical protein